MSISQQSQTDSNSRWMDAPTKSVDVGGTKFIYRELGPDAGLPVIFLNHLAAELDRWDPRVVDGIAANRRVIVFDNRGVGASKGSTPNSMAAMARDAIAFIKALGFEQVDRRCHVVERGTQGSAISHTFKRRRLRRRAKCSSPMREKLGVWRPMSDGVGR